MWWTAGLVASAGQVPVVHIDRTARIVYVLDEQGMVVHQEPVGVGRGGVKDKTAMSDLVTPVGTFEVDLVVAENSAYNDISDALRSRWSTDATYGPLVADLRKLYRNMSALDFNGDGTPDRAYGSAYIGLNSEDAVTGPKMRRFRGTPYWYSIALHGTPDPANLGAASSGGCVHLSPTLLASLLSDGTLKVGQTVVIADRGPPSVAGL